MSNTEYAKIAWPDVQPGDILMHENGDRLTVTRANDGHIASNYLIGTSGYWETLGCFPRRPVPPLDAVPTEPGAYHDKDGVLCVRTTYENNCPWVIDTLGFTTDMMRRRAPFTRLVPMPTEDQVREAIEEALENGFGPEPQDATAAVMSLLITGVDRG